LNPQFQNLLHYSVTPQIKLGDLTEPRIAVFLEEHIADMRSVSPPESKHALDLKGFQQPEISFYLVWDNQTLIGCGALRELDASHGEIKSMRTARNHRGQGIGSRILTHLEEVARERGYARMSLETGAKKSIAPARGLYQKHGFVISEPFASYLPDPNGVL
jgi:putative acetyltransferase